METNYLDPKEALEKVKKYFRETPPEVVRRQFEAQAVEIYKGNPGFMTRAHLSLEERREEFRQEVLRDWGFDVKELAETKYKD